MDLSSGSDFDDDEDPDKIEVPGKFSLYCNGSRQPNHLQSHFNLGGGRDLATAVVYAKSSSMGQLSTASKPVSSISTQGNQMRTSTVTTAGVTTALPQTAKMSNAGGKCDTLTNMSMGMTTFSNTATNYDMKKNMSLSQQGKKIVDFLFL